MSVQGKGENSEPFWESYVGHCVPQHCEAPACRLLRHVMHLLGFTGCMHCATRLHPLAHMCHASSSHKLQFTHIAATGDAAQRAAGGAPADLVVHEGDLHRQQLLEVWLQAAVGSW